MKSKKKVAKKKVAPKRPQPKAKGRSYVELFPYVEIITIFVGTGRSGRSRW